MGLKNIRNRIFPKGTLLFSMYGSIGKVAFAGTELSTNQAILGINVKEESKIRVAPESIIEKSYDDFLNGEAGVKIIEVDAIGNKISESSIKPAL